MCVLRPAAFVGGTLFTVGAYFGILEALNVDHEVFFGYHVRRHPPPVLHLSVLPLFLDFCAA